MLVAVPTGATPQKLNIEYGKPGAEWSSTRTGCACWRWYAVDAGSGICTLPLSAPTKAVLPEAPSWIAPRQAFLCSPSCPVRRLPFKLWLHAIGGEPESRQVYSAVGVFDDAGILAALATKVRRTACLESRACHAQHAGLACACIHTDPLHSAACS